MARPEVTNNRRPVADPVGDADAYGIDEFCERHRISVSLFYKLKLQGLTPVEFRAGGRVLISRESAARWRREREAAGQAAESTDPPERKRRPFGRP
jgi:hypothetical protein